MAHRADIGVLPAPAFPERLPAAYVTFVEVGIGAVAATATTSAPAAKASCNARADSTIRPTGPARRLEGGRGVGADGGAVGRGGSDRSQLQLADRSDRDAGHHAERGRVADRFEVGVLGFEVPEEAFDPGLVGGGAGTSVALGDC